MNRWMEFLNTTSAAWPAWLWRVCWQGALVIAVAWLITLLLRNKSSRLRSWIWRLTYVKLLLLCVWTTPINLPLLPAAESGHGSVARAQGSGGRGQEESTTTVGRAAVPINAATRLRFSDEPSFSRNSQWSELAPTDTKSPLAPANDLSSITAAQSTIPGAQLTLWSYLLLAWLLGMTIVAGRLTYETWLALRLRRSVRLIQSDRLHTPIDEVRQQLGIRSAVQFGESDAAAGPMLVKFRTPCIVFPSGMLGNASPSPQPSPINGEGDRTLSPEETRLVLAHELAHIKRHDLAWNALAAVVHVLLYFHPLVWLASRRSRQEQELACDELVVLRMHVATIDYGQTLIKIVQQIRPTLRTSLVAVGMSGSFKTLSRRIEAMKYIQALSRRQMLLAGFILATLGVIAMVPWRLVAQEAKSFSRDSQRSGAVPTGVAVAQNSAPGGAAQNGAQPGAAANWSSVPGATPFAESPGGVVADPFSGSPGEPGAVGMAPNPPNALSAEALAKIKAQLVGRWRNSAGKEIEFLSDGGFEDLGAKVRIYNEPAPQNGQKQWITKHHRGRGQWTIGPDGALQIDYDEQNIWNTAFGLNHAPSPQNPSPYIYEIVRLNGSFLRLRNNQSADTLFFHRVDEKAEEQPLTDVPDELRPLLAAAQFTPDEAKQLLALFNSEQIDTAALKTIGQVLQAYRHQIDLKQLYGMSPDEVSAFKELLTESGNKLDAHDLFKLAAAGQLSPLEQNGIAKIKAVDAAFDAMVDRSKLVSDIPMSNAIIELQFLRNRFDRAGGLKNGHGGMINTHNLSDSQRTVATKLLTIVEELDEWLQYAVFESQ
jgi:beta-lactamase regulating signal transducer with metallopeptidase domain